MIFITGDTHGDFDRFTSRNWPIGKTLTKDDYVIICGDFGGVWNYPGHKSYDQQEYNLNWLNDKPFTTLFVDGNHCFSNDTELLTKNGWENIVDLYNKENIELAQFQIETGEISYACPLHRIIHYEERLLNIYGPNTDLLVTENHDLIVSGKKVAANYICSNKIKESDTRMSGLYNNKGVDLSDEDIRILTWVIMDGTMVNHAKYMPNSKKITIQFKLSRQDKIEKLKNLLTEMKIPFTFKPATKSGINKLQSYYIRIYGDYSKKIYNQLGGIKTIPCNWKTFNTHQLNIFLGTLKDTDGNAPVGGNSIRWCSADTSNVNIVQEMCIKNNYMFKYTTIINRGFNNAKLQYNCTIFNQRDYMDVYYLKHETYCYNNNVYCFTMPLGTLICRRNGKVSFVGNCNFTQLYAYPQIKKFYGTVGQIRESVLHLRRGQVYAINNKKFFCFGGAESIDKHMRQEGLSWWPEEMLSHAEMDLGLENLQKNTYQVDYIITHTAPTTIVSMLGYTSTPRGVYDNSYDYIKYTDPTTKYLEHIAQTVKFKYWFFGHFHERQQLGKYIVLYKEIIKLEE